MKEAHVGYHKKKIDRYPFGTAYKIKEECEELLDAYEQQASILMLCELADLYGAMEGFLTERFPGIGMSDIRQMSNLTRSAFLEGERK